MNDFLKQKNDVFSKKDKSSINSIDKRIQKFCNTINLRDDMYTLSSCSGRICILEQAKDNNKKFSNWLIVSHNLINEIKNDFFDILNNYNKNNILYFKQEDTILHIRVISIEVGKKLIILAKSSSFNKCSFISIGKKIVIELSLSIPISLPIYDQMILIDKDYLNYLIKISNIKLKKNWGKTEKF